MAFVEDNTPEEEQETQQQGAGSTFVGGGGSGIGARPTTGKTGSGAFTNLKQYLQANKQRTERLGQQVQQDIEKQAQKQQEQFQQSREQAYQPLKQEEQRLGEGAQQQISQTIAGAGTGQQAPLSQEQFAQFRTGYKAEGETPTFTGQKTEAQRFQERLGGLGTAAGRVGELRSLIRRPGGQYTRGQSTLDQLLIGKSKPVQRELMQTGRDVRREYEGISPEEYAAVQSDIQTRRGALEPRRAALQEFATQQLGEARTGLRGEIETREQQAQAQYEAAKALRDSALLEGLDVTAPAEQLKALGLSDLAGGRLYGTKLEDYINVAAGGSPTAQTIATQEEQARLSALAGLAGTETMFDPELAGTYVGSGVDVAGLRQSIESGRQALESAESQYAADPDVAYAQKLLGLTKGPYSALFTGAQELQPGLGMYGGTGLQAETFADLASGLQAQDIVFNPYFGGAAAGSPSHMSPEYQQRLKDMIGQTIEPGGTAATPDQWQQFARERLASELGAETFDVSQMQEMAQRAADAQTAVEAARTRYGSGVLNPNMAGQTTETLPGGLTRGTFT